MAKNGNGKPPILVAIQLSGANDFMNTVIPYTSPVYYDVRPKVSIPQDQVIPIDDKVAFHPSLVPLKELYDEGHVAVIQGTGYPNPTRSHFRSMDIWHTCDPVNIAPEGWLGKVTRELDPGSENPLTCINFGRGLPRALSAQGVSVTSIGDLENYGVMSGVEDQRNEALERFKGMYGQAIGTGPVMDYLGQTGMDVLRGEDLLKQAPAAYSSDVEYADNPIANGLRDVARVHLADLGTRIFYAHHLGYDHHSNIGTAHPKLLGELSGAIMDFLQDMRDHDRADEIVIMVFSEFGRRIRDNGSGTDHGAGGGSFVIGDPVKGGLFAEYPSMNSADWESGEDLRHTVDFRSLYASLLEQWMGMDAAPIVGGTFEQLQLVK